jgi:hypothetical protein
VRRAASHPPDLAALSFDATRVHRFRSGQGSLLRACADGVFGLNR